MLGKGFRSPGTALSWGREGQGEAYGRKRRGWAGRRLHFGWPGSETLLPQADPGGRLHSLTPVPTLIGRVLHMRGGWCRRGSAPSKATGSPQGAGSSHWLVCSGAGPGAGPPSSAPGCRARMLGRNSIQVDAAGRPAGPTGPLWRKRGLPGRRWGTKGWSPHSCQRGGSGSATPCGTEPDVLLSGCGVFPPRTPGCEESTASSRCLQGRPFLLIWGPCY